MLRHTTWKQCLQLWPPPALRHIKRCPVTSHRRDANRGISLSAWQLEVISLMGWMLSRWIGNQRFNLSHRRFQWSYPKCLHSGMSMSFVHPLFTGPSLSCCLSTPLRVQSDDDAPVLWHRTSQNLVNPAEILYFYFCIIKCCSQGPRVQLKINLLPGKLVFYTCDWPFSWNSCILLEQGWNAEFRNLKRAWGSSSGWVTFE